MQGWLQQDLGEQHFHPHLGLSATPGSGAATRWEFYTQTSALGPGLSAMPGPESYTWKGDCLKREHEMGCRPSEHNLQIVLDIIKIHLVTPRTRKIST